MNVTLDVVHHGTADRPTPSRFFEHFSSRILKTSTLNVVADHGVTLQSGPTGLYLSDLYEKQNH